MSVTDTTQYDPGLTSPSEASVRRVDWETFCGVFQWEQGEHCALIGPTGSGKTTLLLSLLDMRTYVVVIGTKPRDRTLGALVHHGYVRMSKWDSRLLPSKQPRRLLWPDASTIHSATNQRKQIYDAMAQIYEDGGWCVAIDELWYIIHHLKLEMVIRTYLQQSRALDISLVVATQRPAFVPLEVYDQSTHLFFWRDNDERNLSRISGLAYLSADEVKQTVAGLERYEFLYINTKEGIMYVTTPPERPEGRKT